MPSKKLMGSKPNKPPRVMPIKYVRMSPKEREAFHKQISFREWRNHLRYPALRHPEFGVKHAAKILGKSRQTVHTYRKKGKISGIKGPVPASDMQRLIFERNAYFSVRRAYEIFMNAMRKEGIEYKIKQDNFVKLLKEKGISERLKGDEVFSVNFKKLVDYIEEMKERESKLTRKQVREMLGISRQTLSAAIKRRDIETVTVSGRNPSRIPKKEFEKLKWIQENVLDAKGLQRELMERGIRRSLDTIKLALREGKMRRHTNIHGRPGTTIEELEIFLRKGGFSGRRVESQYPKAKRTRRKKSELEKAVIKADLMDVIGERNLRVFLAKIEGRSSKKISEEFRILETSIVPIFQDVLRQLKINRNPAIERELERHGL